MLFKARPGNLQITPRRYAGLAIVLHWLIAALLVYQFALGTQLEHVSKALQFTAFQMHKSVGITILLLSLARLAVRLLVPKPARYDRGIKGTAASLTHLLFYVVMIGGPLTGWAVVSASRVKVPTVVFGLFNWPHLPLGTSLSDSTEGAHVVLVFMLPVLIGLHVAGVLYHLFRRDEVPQRMVPLSQPLVGVIAGLALLALAAFLGRFGPLPHLWDAKAMLAVAPSTEATTEPDADASFSVDPVATGSAMPSELASASEEVDEQAAVDWIVDPGSRIGFTTSYTGAPISGTFKRWSAKIRFGAEDLANSRIDASIDLRSVDTSDDTRDTTLKGEDFFAADKYSTATLTARSFSKAGPGRFTGKGTLSLHGVNKPVTLSFTLKETGDKAAARGTASLSRLAFGVGSGDWSSTDAVPDAVGVEFAIAAHKAS